MSSSRLTSSLPRLFRLRRGGGGAASALSAFRLPCADDLISSGISTSTSFPREVDCWPFSALCGRSFACCCFCVATRASSCAATEEEEAMAAPERLASRDSMYSNLYD